MNWINAFELLCYGITAMLLWDILRRKRWEELRLFLSAALAGFILELLAVRVTGIYHYSSDFYISIGFAPYQFPFFGGLMWGGLTVCALRIAEKLGLGKWMTALGSGWLIVSMDLLLDVAAIRLNGGFWVWDGREITLDVTHHMFMSVIWVNFLGYLFETPAVVLLTLLSRNRKDVSLVRKALLTVGIGLAGVAIVGAASGLSLLLNSITDEWFACIAFLLLWGFLLARMLAQIIGGRCRLTLKGKKDWVLLLFWAAMYGYCLAALWSLKIPQAVPWYCISLSTGLQSWWPRKSPGRPARIFRKSYPPCPMTATAATTTPWRVWPRRSTTRISARRSKTSFPLRTTARSTWAIPCGSTPSP